jgi:Methyltransferase domain
MRLGYAQWCSVVAAEVSSLMLAPNLNLKCTSSTVTSCKICDGEATAYGAVDFHKCCEEVRGFRLPPSGVQINYRRCTRCGFLFTEAFDDWSAAQFSAHIYNDGYLAVDPDYQLVRPRGNVGLVNRLWGQSKDKLRLLDYGGGNGVLCNTLRAAGYPVAVTYDPFVAEYARRPAGKYNLVTCFETLEHMPDPLAGIASINRSNSINLVSIGGMSARGMVTSRSSADRRSCWPGSGAVTSLCPSATSCMSRIACCQTLPQALPDDFCDLTARRQNWEYRSENSLRLQVGVICLGAD